MPRSNPYASDKQRRFLHAEKPDVAARFDKEMRKSKDDRKKRGKVRRKK